MCVEMFIGYWLVAGLFGLVMVRKTLGKYRNRQVYKDENNEFVGLVREDFGRWPVGKLYLGALLLFPLRLLILFWFLLLNCLLLLLCSCLPAKMRVSVLLVVGKVGAIMLKGLIMTREDFSHQKISTPIVIANHVNWFDTLYVASRFYPVSIVADSHVGKIPVVRIIVRMLDCILIDRSKEASRADTLQLIQQRIHRFYHEGNQKKEVMTEAFPIAIFPEGTTSNGKALLKFKTGAFEGRTPVTAFCLSYQCEGLDMGMDEITQLEHIVLCFCLWAKLDVKKIILQAKDEETVQEYTDRCKDEMARILNHRKSQAGFREKKKLEKITRQQKQE